MRPDYDDPTHYIRQARQKALREVRDAIDRTGEMSETTMLLLFGPGGQFEITEETE